jgi:hypothetical protein
VAPVTTLVVTVSRPRSASVRPRNITSGSAYAARVDEPTGDDSPYIETHDLSLVTREGLSTPESTWRSAVTALVVLVVRRRQAFTMEDLHPSLEMV